MNSAFDISFCIPTYNFAAFIGATLDSIIAQADDRVQIVIVDGGSTDETASIVADRKRDFPNIKFIQRRERCGVDRDILESVAQADGELCWLFSSDDHLAPGAIEALRAEAAEDWDVFLTNIMICDVAMHPLHRHRTVDVNQVTTFDWSDPGQRAWYFSRAATTTAFFSFISGIVVRRSSWNSIPPQQEFIGSCWIIAAQLFALAQRRLLVKYYPGTLTLKRSDNDSFMSIGLVRRIGLSVDGFRRVAEHYFGAESPEARHVSRVIKNEFTFLYMFLHKLQVAARNDPQQDRDYAALVRRNYGDGHFPDLVRRTAILTPTSILLVLVAGYRRIKPARRIARRILEWARRTLRPEPLDQGLTLPATVATRS
jgi:abequosyltransferase